MRSVRSNLAFKRDALKRAPYFYVRVCMMSTFDERAAWIYEIRESVKSSAIETTSRHTLTKYSTWLCDPDMRVQSSGGEYEQLCELVRLHMLRTFMEEIEKRNTFMQYLVIVLAVAALVVAIPQIWFAYKADKRAEPNSKTMPVPLSELKSQMSAPILAQPPSTHPVASPEEAVKTTTRKS